MKQESLALKLEGNAIVNPSNVNMTNSVITLSKVGIPKIANFYNNKKILLAIKPDKIKIGLDNVIVVPEEINIENTQPINVRNTYVATAKKEVINEAIELINNLKSFKDLVKVSTLAPTPEPPIAPTPVFVEPEIKPLEPVNIAPEAPNTDALPKVSENTFFDLNKVPTIDEIDANPKVAEVPTFDGSKEINLQNALNNVLDNSTLNETNIPKQTIPNIITDTPNNSGHIKSKFVPILFIIIFLAACGFAVYEAINYLKITGKI